MGILKGQWQSGTDYKFGDLVYVQCGYPAFMGMPTGQLQTFVFRCSRPHTSSGTKIQFFTPTNEHDYLEPGGESTIPRGQVNDDDGEIWQLSRYGYVRQHWFWDHDTNSVTATLFTDAMDELRYPFHDNTDQNFLLSRINSNVPHTLAQEQAIIVSIGSELTIWHSNWWKARRVRSGAASEISFPIESSQKRHVIDGELLWSRNEWDSTIEGSNRASILLPIDTRIVPFSTVQFFPYTTMDDNMSLRIVNITASQLNATSNLSRDSPGGTESLACVFDPIRCVWFLENT